MPFLRVSCVVRLAYWWQMSLLLTALACFTLVGATALGLLYYHQWLFSKGEGRKSYGEDRWEFGDSGVASHVLPPPPSSFGLSNTVSYTVPPWPVVH